MSWNYLSSTMNAITCHSKIDSIIERYIIQLHAHKVIAKKIRTKNIFFTAAWYDTQDSLRDMLHFFLRVHDSHPYIEEQNEKIFFLTTGMQKFP